MALSAIKRAEEQIRTSTTIEILKGIPSPTVKRMGYDQLKTYGVGKELSTQDWQDYLLQMLQLGFIEIVYDQKNIVRITPSGNNVLFGRDKATLCVINRTLKEAQKPKKRLHLEIPSISIPGLASTSGQEDKRLFEALRVLRQQCANEEGFPPYIVFSDKVLHSLATIKPTTLEQFGFISGIGEHKKQKYGQRFVALIQKYCS
jgi:ATP-dependent DNA helicase RecQ